MDNPKAEKTEESTKPTSFLSQDMTVIWMAEQKPDSNESRHVTNPTADVNRTETGVMESTPENEADRSMDRAASSKKSVHWSPELVSENSFAPSPDRSNVYVSRSSATAPPSSVNFQDTVSSVRSVLGIWGKKVGEASKTAADLAGNTWQHLKTSPSFTEAAMGRIAQGTKLLAEGGYEKIFRQTFETVPEEKLINSFACYLSTSAGPVMGVLYVSTAKFAYCSDNPLPYEFGDQTEWSYYKVVIPLRQIKAVIPSSSRLNGADQKYIQVISLDNHEFWFMGFLNYEGAVKCLEGASQASSLP